MIRLAAEADISRLTDIRNAVRENRLSDPSLVTPADYRWFIAQRSLFVWQENDVLVGFSAADARDGSIWALFVDPLYEGRGIGRVLLEHACSVLERAGFAQIWLTTAPGTRAARFYEAAGWRAAGCADGQLKLEFTFRTEARGEHFSANTGETMKRYQIPLKR